MKCLRNQRRFFRLPAMDAPLNEAARAVAARLVRGSFEGGKQKMIGVRVPMYKASRSRSGSTANAAEEATAAPPQAAVDGWQLAGLWGLSNVSVPPLNPCAFELDAGCTMCTAGGWVHSGADAVLAGADGNGTDGSKTQSSGGGGVVSAALAAVGTMRSGSWALVKDDYVIVAYKRVFGSLWRNGREVHSERVSEMSAQALSNRSLAGCSTLGGDNKRECGACGKRCDTTERTVLRKAPRHLILTLKRMWFDWRANRTVKMLQHVSFDAWLRAPKPPPAAELPADLAAELHGGSSGGAAPLYGLYAVVVHTGLGANSGHYYAFCRSSATRGLWRRDLPMAPWTKFNDAKVSEAALRCAALCCAALGCEAMLTSTPLMPTVVFFCAFGRSRPAAGTR